MSTVSQIMFFQFQFISEKCQKGHLTCSKRNDWYTRYIGSNNKKFRFDHVGIQSILRLFQSIRDPTDVNTI